jgi:hypothetical protein
LISTPSKLRFAGIQFVLQPVNFSSQAMLKLPNSTGRRQRCCCLDSVDAGDFVAQLMNVSLQPI